MAKNNFHPGEEHRERIVSLFTVLSERKFGTIKTTSRGEMEKEIRAHPEKYPELNALTDTYLKICLTKILNTDPRTSPDPVWRWVWSLSEGSR